MFQELSQVLGGRKYRSWTNGIHDVSLQVNNSLYIKHITAVSFGVKEVGICSIMVDKERCLIGLQFHADPPRDAAFRKIVQVGNSYRVNLGTWLGDLFDIPARRAAPFRTNIIEKESDRQKHFMVFSLAALRKDMEELEKKEKRELNKKGE